MTVGNLPAQASACDAVVSDASELDTARACYQNELAGSITTVTVDADFTLSFPFRPQNNNGATFILDGAGHTITGPSGDDVIESKPGPLEVRNVTLVAASTIHAVILHDSDDSLTVQSSTLQTPGGRGIFSSGDGALIFEGSELVGITNDGIRTLSATSSGVTVTNSSISGFSQGISSVATVNVVDSTLSNNTTGINLSGTVAATVSNSTIVGSPSVGHGVVVPSGATVSLTGVTIADIADDTSAFALRGAGEATLTGTAIARATNNNNLSCSLDLTVIDNGGNVVEGDCGSMTPNPNAAVGLGVLAANSCGAGIATCTPTISIDSIASPLVGAWGDCVATLPDDQRGVARTAGTCDAGAYESAFACPTTAANEAELIAAVNCYNLAQAGEDVSVTLTQSIALTSALPAIENDTSATFTVEGDGEALTGLVDTTIIDIIDGDVTLNDITVDGAGGSTALVGAVGVGDLAEVTINRSTFTSGNRYHLRLIDQSTVTINDSLFEASPTTQSIIRSENIGDGSLVVTNTTFKDATSHAIHDLGSVTVADSTFEGNGQAITVGAGGTAVIANSTFASSVTTLRVASGGDIQLTGVTIIDASEGIAGSGSVGLTGTLIAVNGTNCFASLAVTDNGGNIVQNGCGAIPATPNAATGLGVLGPSTCGPTVSSCTDTVPILEAISPAVNAWGVCAPVVDDQRGVARSAGNCDAGAYESPFDCAAAPIVTEADLVVAINCYNLATTGAESLATLSNDLTLTSALPSFDNATDATFELAGAGFTLTAVPELSALTIDDGNVLLTDITVVASTTGFGDDDPVIAVGPSANLDIETAIITDATGDAIQFEAGATISVLDSVINVGENALEQSTSGPGASVTITNSTITAVQGGVQTDGTALISNSTIDSTLEGIETSGMTTISNSTVVSRNLYVGTATSSLIATNSTFVGEAPGDGISVDGTATLAGVTIVDVPGDGLYGDGEVTLSGVLLARNAIDCDLGDGLTVIDAAGNLTEDGCGSIAAFPDAEFGVGTLTASSCAAGTCPDTIPLTADSFAVNAWGDCGAVTTDQRGVARTAGQCDAGAFEAFDCPTAVDSRALLTLAIRCYNLAEAGTTTVLNITQPLTLDVLLPVVDNPTDATLMIEGGANTLNGAAVSRILDIANGDVALNNLTLDGGTFQLISVENAAKLTITNSLLTGAEREGIMLAGTAALSMTDSVMSANSTNDLNGRTIDNLGGSGSVSLTRVELANETADPNSDYRAFGVSGPNLTIVDSTFRGFVFGVEAGEGSSISNTTIASNNFGITTDGAVSLNHVTSINTSRALNVNADSTVTLANSLLVSPSGACTLDDNLTSVVVDGLGNIIDNGCGPIAATANAATGVGDLAANPCATGVACTKTVALDATSPALGAVDTCGLPLDQRGVARAATDCDAGAYEAPNVAPTANDDAVSTFAVFEDDDPFAIDVLDNDSDPESAITVTAVSGLTANSGAVTIDPGGTGVTYTPALNFNGAVSFDYTITDGAGATGTATVTLDVAAVNDPPEVDADAFTVDEHSEANVLDVLANDVDVDGDDLILSNGSITTPAGSGSALSVDGKLVFTPTPGFVGELTFTYDVSDGTDFDSFTRTATVTVTVENVNEPPVASNDNTGTTSSLSIVEDSGPNELDVLANDTDPDIAFGDELTVASVTQPTGGTAAISADGGSVILTPDDDFAGSLVFTYAVQDAAGLSDLATVSAFVSGVNDRPVAQDDNVFVDENLTADISVQDNDNDVDNPPSQLTVSVITEPSAGTATVFGTRIRYVPPVGFLGTVSFDYTITDPDGLSATATVTVTVENLNEAPTARDDFVSVDEDTTSNSFDVLDNDTDPDEGDAVRVVSTADAANGTVTIAADGLSVSYTPDPGFDGNDEFGYTIEDQDGESATAIVRVFVTDANRSPAAEADAIVVAVDAVTRLDVLDNDSDPDGDTITIVSATQPFPITAGTVEIVDDGAAIELTSLPDFVGTATFSYIIVDPDGRSGSAVVTLTAATECMGQAVTIVWSPNAIATNGDDVILGTPGDDVIDALDGDDLVCAGDGNDTVIGGDGDDVLIGGDGRDIMRGNAGVDLVEGEAGNDRLLGGIDGDTLIGGDGDDFLGGFGGDDTIEGGDGDDTIFGGFGADTIDGGAGDDVISGLVGNDIIDGGNGADRLNGDRGNDTINGGNGADTINGGNGDDILRGNGGDDNVNGGRADDQLSGGSGTNDRCVGNDQNVADTADDTCEKMFGVP